MYTCPSTWQPSEMSRISGYFAENVLESLRQRPGRLTPAEWLAVAGYVALAAAIGFGTGMFQLGWPSLGQLLILPPLLLLYPSIVEEALFRGLLLPRLLHEASVRAKALALVASTLIFVAWHPLNHYLIGISDTSLFIKPGFLVIVAALGLLSGYLSLRTRSLWPAILLHWATTVVWNLFLGRPG